MKSIPQVASKDNAHPISRQLLEIYQRLLKFFGPQGWWPGDTPFEVCIGAILTQNTNWRNVEKAITTLKSSALLEPEALHQIPAETLARLIRPAGYYNLKAVRIKAFINFIFEHFNGRLENMFQVDPAELRNLLLKVKGIGPETADSMVLYAFDKPSFVVDAYTMRILYRHNLIYGEADYDEVRRLFMDFLPEDVELFNEYHALLVRLGKEYCRRKRPRCTGCPLEGV